MKQQNGRSVDPSNRKIAQRDPRKPVTGYAGKPLDGSQYLDIIEEQKYAEQRPTPEEQKPRRAYRDKSP
jgi:hypothetical protein